MGDVPRLLPVGSLGELEKKGCIVVAGAESPIAVFLTTGPGGPGGTTGPGGTGGPGGQPRAVDNRCPHLGFPLSRGTVKDGILVCHWHRARFDLACGATLDPWADDVPAYPVEVRDGQVWVADRPAGRDPVQHASERLRSGLERDIRLVLAKSAIALDASAADYRVALAEGARFGTRNRVEGWSSGLSILTMAANLLPHLAAEDRPRALYHGLLSVSADCAGHAPRFPLAPLATAGVDPARLKRWLRELVEVRDQDGTERVLATAVAARLPPDLVADMLFAAATDRVYLDGGHALDFVGKALELLDHLGFEAHAAHVIPGLAGPLVRAERMEESAGWRSPIDLIEILRGAHDRLGRLLAAPAPRPDCWMGRGALTNLLLGEDPQAAIDALESSLASGAEPQALAETVAYAAALRVARFPTSNEFGDWDTALHTFTFACAALQAVRRTGAGDAMRAVLDAAMSVYLDRFLNIPSVALPEPELDAGLRDDTQGLLAQLGAATDAQQQVDRAGLLCASYLAGGGDPARLRAKLGEMLLREDAHFHTFQMAEAGFQLAHRLGDGDPASRHVLVAVARYLAAHAPTSRVRGQTYRTALRLLRGESVHEEESPRG